VANIIGDVAGRRCILFDDMIDGGGTLCNAAQALVDGGAAEVSAYCQPTACLSGGAVERVQASVLKELVMTDSIAAARRVGDMPKIRYVSCAGLIGEAIRRIANEESVVEAVRLEGQPSPACSRIGWRGPG
jgi:ribose-phosphate pyrophosphokinase